MPDFSQLKTWLVSVAAQARDTRPLMAVVAKSMEVVYRRHFAEREAAGNKRGWPSRHFWQREVARLMSREHDAQTATVKIASPAYMHKVSGGRITPKRGRALAIPQSARAYAAGSPRVSGLPLVFIPDLERKVIGWLVEHEVYRLGKRLKGGGWSKTHATLKNEKTLGTLHYVLVPYVDQAPDPHAEPSAASISDAVREDVQAWLARLSS